MNLSEDDNNIYATLEVPGLSMDEIELTLADTTLVIKGERKTGEGKFYHRERPTGVFQRVINLNVPVQRDAVKARLANGLLEVTLPKAEELKPRRVQIQSS